MGACQTELVAQRVHEQQARLHLEVVLGAVDVEAHGNGPGHTSPPLIVDLLVKLLLGWRDVERLVSSTTIRAYRRQRVGPAPTTARSARAGAASGASPRSSGARASPGASPRAPGARASPGATTRPRSRAGAAHAGSLAAGAATRSSAWHGRRRRSGLRYS